MKPIPIRLRLTLWYCFIFGLLLVTITSIIYSMHRLSHYREMDTFLESVSVHILDEYEKGLNQGKSLDQVDFSLSEFAINDIYIVIRDAQGAIIRKNTEAIPLPLGHLPITKSNENLHTISNPLHGRYREIVMPIKQNERTTGFIQAELSLKSLDQSLNRFLLFIIGITIGGLVLAAFAGWFLARHSLNRVGVIRNTAKSIADSKGFAQRVLYTGPQDELGELAETFNEMLESLETAYISQKRFIADASHELRTPLTTIRGNLDILLRNLQRMTAEDQEDMLKDTRSETVRMVKLVSDLLALARADASVDYPMNVVKVDPLLREIESEVTAWRSSASIRLTITGRPVTWGNRDLLKQLFLILAENAIKYTEPGGEILLSSSVSKDLCLISVKDDGIGIDPVDVPYIFDRFYRSDRGRTHAAEGTGLGLSIAKWIVDLHRGGIVITSYPEEGSEFQIRLPLVKVRGKDSQEPESG